MIVQAVADSATEVESKVPSSAHDKSSASIGVATRLPYCILSGSCTGKVWVEI